MLMSCRASNSSLDNNTRWTVANINQGLCIPSSSTSAPFGTLEECHRFARPEGREMRWNVVNTSGYGTDGSVVAECRPTLDPYAQFSHRY